MSWYKVFGRVCVEYFHDYCWLYDQVWLRGSNRGWSHHRMIKCWLLMNYWQSLSDQSVLCDLCVSPQSVCAVLPQSQCVIVNGVHVVFFTSWQTAEGAGREEGGGGPTEADVGVWGEGLTAAGNAHAYSPLWETVHYCSPSVSTHTHTHTGHVPKLKQMPEISFHSEPVQLGPVQLHTAHKSRTCPPYVTAGPSDRSHLEPPSPRVAHSNSQVLCGVHAYKNNMIACAYWHCLSQSVTHTEACSIRLQKLNTHTYSLTP